MSHTATVTRRNRTAYMLLLDLSGSMQEITHVDGGVKTKAEVVVDICNKSLAELYMRAMRDNEVRNYYDVAIYAYSSDRVFSLLNNDIDNPFVSITELSQLATQGGGGFIEFESIGAILSPERLSEMASTTIAVSPRGATPMYEALYYAKEALGRWCSDSANFNSLPPMVFNLSDGVPTDCDLQDIVEISNQITDLRTNDGEVLLLNIQIESPENSLSLLFPAEEEVEQLSNGFVKMMCRASSVMPEHFEPLIHQLRPAYKGGRYCGMGHNISVTDIISMTCIGTIKSRMK